MCEGSRPTVLVVDDDAGIRETLTEVLGDRYDVALASDGAEAIQWLGQHRSAVGAVVLDLQMPNLGGLRVLEYLRWARLAVPVLLHTANASMAQVVRRQALPVAHILVKPVSQREMLTQVEAVLHTAA